VNNKISKKHNFGWYGNCGTSVNPCENYDLNEMSAKIYDGTTPTFTNVRGSVESIVRVHDNDGERGGMVFEKFCTYNNMQIPASLNKSFDDYFNVNFKEMKCGEAYIVNTRGQFTDFEIGDIENPRVSSFYLSGVNEHGGVSSCEDNICYAEDSVEFAIASSISRIEDRVNMVSSTSWGSLRGSIAYPQRDAGIVDVTPLQVNVYGPEEDGVRVFLGALTYAGVPSGGSLNQIYVYVTSGLDNFLGQCLRGDVKFKNDDDTYINVVNCNLDLWN
jgi:hypothetical protein